MIFDLSSFKWLVIPLVNDQPREEGAKKENQKS